MAIKTTNKQTKYSISLSPKDKERHRDNKRVETTSGNRGRFNRLLDDAVLGVKKK